MKQKMATKLKIKVGDTVRVIAGASKGQEGKIQKVLVEKNKVVTLQNYWAPSLIVLKNIIFLSFFFQLF